MKLIKSLLVPLAFAVIPLSGCLTKGSSSASDPSADTSLSSNSAYSYSEAEVDSSNDRSEQSSPASETTIASSSSSEVEGAANTEVPLDTTTAVAPLPTATETAIAIATETAIATALETAIEIPTSALTLTPTLTPTPEPTTGGPVPNDATVNVYYVDKNDPGADDSNVGTSESEPWKTLDHAYETVRPGDFVYIKGSTDPTSATAIYDRSRRNGFNIVTPGEAGKLIVFRSYPGHTVILQGNGGKFGILLDHASYHHFYGFIVRDFEKAAEGGGAKTDITIEKSEFTKTSESGLRLRDVTNIVLRDVYIHHCNESGVSVRNGKNVLFERVESSFNDDHKGVDGDGDGFHTYGGDNIVFINAIARSNSEDGFDLNANATLINVLSENHPAANLKLWRRSVDNWAPKKMTVINSIFRNSGETGIKISEGAELHLYNSIVDNAGEDAIGFRTPSNESQTPVTSEIINSIVTNSKEGVILLPGNLLKVDNDIFFNNDYRDVFGFSVDATSLVDVDPMFVDEGDYHLKADSPAIDKGVVIDDANLQQDIDGQARSMGVSSDIGVDEL